MKYLIVCDDINYDKMKELNERLSEISEAISEQFSVSVESLMSCFSAFCPVVTTSASTAFHNYMEKFDDDYVLAHQVVPYYETKETFFPSKSKNMCYNKNKLFNRKMNMAKKLKEKRRMRITK